jgi:hypothetical protein
MQAVIVGTVAASTFSDASLLSDARKDESLGLLA